MRSLIVFGMVMAFLPVPPAFGGGYQGTYVTKSGGTALTLVLEQDASGRITGTLSGKDRERIRLEGAVEEGIASGVGTGPAGRSYFEAEFEGDTLVFTLIEPEAKGGPASRSLEFVREKTVGKPKAPPPAAASSGTAAKPPSSPNRAAGTPRPSAQTDTGLMRYFAGRYYSFSSGSTIYGSAGTERTITLCPDGRYLDSYEFSASGTGGPDWGGATSRRGAARWTIQGNQTQGVITVTYPNGQTKSVPFQVISKQEGSISFDGIKFAYAGAPQCP